MRQTAYIILILLISVSCRKREPATWDTKWIAPVVYGTLDFSSLIQDSIVSANPDSCLILDFDQTIVDLTLSDIVAIPDTSITEKFTIPPPLQNLNIQPGIKFFDEPKDFQYDGLDVSLSKVSIKEGVMEYSIVSPIDRKTVVTYKIPGATKNNIPFEIKVNVDAAPANGVSTTTGSVDMTDYEFNLRGVSNSLYNTLETDFSVELASGEAATVMFDTDTILLNTSFVGLVPSYAKGYFGQQNFIEQDQDLKNDILDFYGGGTIDIQNLKVGLFLDNKIGVDGRIKINYLRGINTVNQSFLDLVHPDIGQSININRATDNGSSAVSQAYEIQLHDLNSNVESFFELLPQSFAYDVEIDLNPLGNVSNATDFAYCEGGISARLKVEMPLSFVATDLILNDTLEFDLSNENVANLKEISISFDIENHFPFSADAKLFLIDDNGVIVDTITGGFINEGVIDLNGFVVASSFNTLNYALDESQTEILMNSGKVIVSAKLNTPGTNHISIKQHYYMEIKAIAKATIGMKL